MEMSDVHVWCNEMTMTHLPATVAHFNAGASFGLIASLEPYGRWRCSTLFYESCRYQRGGRDEEEEDEAHDRVPSALALRRVSSSSMSTNAATRSAAVKSTSLGCVNTTRRLKVVNERDRRGYVGFGAACCCVTISDEPLQWRDWKHCDWTTCVGRERWGGGRTKREWPDRWQGLRQIVAFLHTTQLQHIVATTFIIIYC